MAERVIADALAKRAAENDAMIKRMQEREQVRRERAAMLQAKALALLTDLPVPDEVLTFEGNRDDPDDLKMWIEWNVGKYTHMQTLYLELELFGGPGDSELTPCACMWRKTNNWRTRLFNHSFVKWDHDALVSVDDDATIAAALQEQLRIAHDEFAQTADCHFCMLSLDDSSGRLQRCAYDNM